MPALPELPEWVLDRRRKIGRHIQQQREYANLTQDDVIRKTGLSRSTVQRIEAGEREVRLSWLILIADALNVPIGLLLTLDTDA